MLAFDNHSNNANRPQSPTDSYGTLRDHSEPSGEEDDFKETENGKEERQIEEFLATAPPEDEDVTVKRLEEKIQKLHQEFSTETPSSSSNSLFTASSPSKPIELKSQHSHSIESNPAFRTPDKKRKHVMISFSISTQNKIYNLVFSKLIERATMTTNRANIRNELKFESGLSNLKWGVAHIRRRTRSPLMKSDPLRQKRKTKRKLHLKLSSYLFHTSNKGK